MLSTILWAEKPLDDSWYILTFDKAYLGYIHNIVKQAPWHGKSMIQTSIDTNMILTRMKMKLNVSVHTLYVDNLQHEPVYFYSEVSLSSMKTITEGTIEGKNIIVTQTRGGKRINKKIILDNDTIFPSSKFKDIKKGDLIKGNKLSYKIFMPSFLILVKYSVKVKGNEKITFAGNTISAIKTVSYNDITPSVPTIEWVDASGEVLQFETEMLGAKMKGTKTNREKALNKNGDSKPIEMFVNFLIKPDKQLKNSSELYEIKYNLRLIKGDIPTNFIEDDRQRIISKTNNSLILKVVKKKLPRDNSNTFPLKEKKVSKFLEPTTFVQSSDPAIIAQAKKIVGNEKSTIQAAKKITAWVYKNIKKKNLSVGFASASEVIQNLEGDCSEHSVLATALCRAVGIPARTCIGIVYSPMLKAFGYHLWFEVYAGSWYQFDPTLYQLEPDPTHIVFAKGNMDGSQLIKSSATLNHYISNLKINILTAK